MNRLFADESLFHDSADLELDGSFFGHRDALEGFGVLSDASGPDLAFENAEVSELQAVTVPQFLDDFVEEPLDHKLDDDALIAGLVGNAIDKFFLCDGSHVGTLLQDRYDASVRAFLGAPRRTHLAAPDRLSRNQRNPSYNR